MSKIEEVRIEELHPFEENPFKTCNETEQEELIQSIREFGIITPLIVRKIDDGYEIVSGHRRYETAKVIGLKTVPAYVKEFSKDEAMISFVDCNLSREKILPSEKAHGYKMKYEAMKRQGFRSDLTSSQLVTKSRSDEMLAENSPDTRMQIQRFIRLTNLEHPLLDMVDEGKIALTPAYHLSFLNEEEQQFLIEAIEVEDCTPSVAQALKMKRMSEEGTITEDSIFAIMSEQKANQKEMIKIPADKIRKYFKPDASTKKIEETIIKALEFYARHLQRKKNQEVR